MGGRIGRKKPWTDDELARVRSMIETRASALRIALALKRPVVVVKQKAREMGMPFRHDRELAKDRRKITGIS